MPLPAGARHATRLSAMQYVWTVSRLATVGTTWSLSDTTASSVTVVPAHWTIPVASRGSQHRTRTRCTTPLLPWNLTLFVSTDRHVLLSVLLCWTMTYMIQTKLLSRRALIWVGLALEYCWPAAASDVCLPRFECSHNGGTVWGQSDSLMSRCCLLLVVVGWWSLHWHPCVHAYSWELASFSNNMYFPFPNDSYVPMTMGVV